MHFVSVQLLLEVLMVVVKIGAKMTLLIQQVESIIYTNHCKPTQVINNSLPCSDLIFCTNQMVISKYVVDSSIFGKCHHNFIYGKVNIPVPFQPKYVREVWDYSNADVQNIKKSIENFNGGKDLESFSIDSKVDLLNKRLLNIFWNHISNKKIKRNHGQLPWMTDRSLKERSKLTKC